MSTTDPWLDRRNGNINLFCHGSSGRPMADLVKRRLFCSLGNNLEKEHTFAKYLKVVVSKFLIYTSPTNISF